MNNNVKEGDGRPSRVGSGRPKGGGKNDSLLDPASEDKIFRVEEDDLQRYLTEMRLDTFFSSIVEELLVEAPNNPVKFLIDYMLTNYPDQALDSSFAKTYPTVANSMGGGVPLTGIVEASSRLKDADEDEDEHQKTRKGNTQQEKDEQDEEESIPKDYSISSRRNAIFQNVSGEDNNIAPKEGTVDKEELLKLMEDNLYFQQLSKPVKEALCAVFSLKSFQENDVIFREDQPGKEFYFIQQGKVEHSIKDGRVIFGNVGDSMGETCLLYSCPNATTAKIVSETANLYVIDRVMFKSTVKSTLQNIREERIKVLRKITLFENTLTEVEWMTLAEDVVVEERFKQGEVLVKQHGPSDKMFIVVSGTARCEQRLSPSRPGAFIISFEPFDYFGEIALIADRPRAASVVAETDVTCLTIPREAFIAKLGSLIDIVKRDQGLYRRFVSDKI